MGQVTSRQEGIFYEKPVLLSGWNFGWFDTLSTVLRVRCSYCDRSTVHAVAAAYGPSKYSQQYSNLQ